MLSRDDFFCRPFKSRFRKPLSFLTALLLSFTSSLVVSPDELFAAPVVEAPVSSPGAIPPSGANQVLITVRVVRAGSDPLVVANGVYLFRVDAAGKNVANLGTMRDDGTNGDAAAGDSIFSLRINIAQPPQDGFRVQASVPFQRVVRRSLSPVTVIPVLVNNLAPVFTSEPGTEAVENRIYLYQVEAEDPEGGEVTLALENAPEGCTLFPNGLLRWVPRTFQIGDQEVTIKGTDPGGKSALQSFTIAVADGNEPPVFTSLPRRQAKAGEEYVYNARAYDPEGTALVFSLDKAPEGMTVDGAAGTIRWNPDTQIAGKSPDVVLRVADAGGAFALQSYKIEVAGEPLDLIKPVNFYDVFIGDTLELDLAANYESAGFRVTPMPENARIDLNAKKFIFTPRPGQAGIYNMAFSAIFGGMRDENPVLITVRNKNQPPVLEPVVPQSVKEGEPLRIPVSASDPDGDDLEFILPDLTVGNLYFDSVKREIVFAPDFDQAGEYQVLLRVSDGHASDEKTVTITVADVTAPALAALDLVVDKLPNPSFRTALPITGSVVGEQRPVAYTPPVLITGVSPAQISPGRRLTMMLTGLNTAFDQGTTTLSLGQGITVESLEVLSPTSLKAVVRAAEDAAEGERPVLVKQDLVEVSSLIAFEVLQAGSSVQGTLIDEFTQQALQGARIVVNGTPVIEVADDDGKFLLEGVVPGKHTLVITRRDYEVLKLDLELDKNQSLNLGTLGMKALARPFVPGGSLPRAATVASVIDRGVSSQDLDLTLDQAKALVLDTLLAIPGQEYGAVDEAGNQLNPNLIGGGMISLTPTGVEQHALAILEGQTYTLAEFIESILQCFNWMFGHTLTPRSVLYVLQASADRAWANPADPFNAIPLMVFNQGGTVLTPEAPVLTMSTRINHMQGFLLTSSFLIHFAPIIDLAFEELYKNNGMEPPKVTYDPVTGESLIHIHGQIIRTGQSTIPQGGLGQAITVASSRFSDAFLGGAVYAADENSNEVSDQAGNSASKSVWDNPWVANAWDLTKAAIITAGFIILGKFLFALATVGTAGTLGLTAGLLLTIAGAVLIGVLLQTLSQLVSGFFGPQAQEALRPGPPAAITHGRDTVAKKVFIRFPKDKLHIKQKTSPDELWFPGFDTIVDLFGYGVNLKMLEFEYQLWRFPHPGVLSTKAPGVELVSTLAMPASNGQKDMMEFVLPIARLKDASLPGNDDAKNIFKVRTVIFYRGYIPFPFVPGGPEEFATNIELEDLGVEQLSSTLSTEGKAPLSLPNAGEVIAGDVEALNDKLTAAETKFKADAAAIDSEVAGILEKGTTLRAKQALFQGFVEEHTEKIAENKNLLSAAEKETLARYQKIHRLTEDFISTAKANGFKRDFMFTPGKKIHGDLVIAAGGQANLDAMKFNLDRWAQNLERGVDLKNAFDVQTKNANTMAVQKQQLQRGLAGANSTSTRIVTIQYDVLDPDGFSETPESVKVKKSYLIDGTGKITDVDTGLTTTAEAEIAKVEAQEVLQKRRIEHVSRQQAANAKSTKLTETDLLQHDFIREERIKQITREINTRQMELEEAAKRRDLMKKELETANIEEAEKIKTAQEHFDKAKANVDALQAQKLKADKSLLARISNSKAMKAINSPKGQVAIQAATFVGDTAWGIRDRIKCMPSPFSGPYTLVRRGDEVTVTDPLAPPVYPPQEPGYDPGELPPGGIARVAGLLGEKISGLNPFGLPLVFAQTVPLVFAPNFEPDMDENFPLAFLTPFRDKDNPKGGFIVREFPFSAPQAELADAGFPSDQIAMDSTGAVYLINNNSLEKFGGRLFRFKGEPIKREHIGQINYYSQMIGYSRGAAPAAMEIAEFREGGTIVEDLFIANKEEGIPLMNGQPGPPNRVLRVPVHLADTNPSFANGQNRDRIVGQPYAAHPEFKFAGINDMERDGRVTQDATDAPGVLYLADDINIFALKQIPGSDQAEVIKIISIPGRKWSGLASDANGNLFFGDYVSGDIYLLAAEELDAIVQGSNSVITANGELDNRAYLLKVGLDRPGDIELDTAQERYIVSTPNGYEAFDLVLIGRYGDSVLEIRSDVLQQEAPVTLRGARGRVFIVGATTESPHARRVRLRVKRLDGATGKSYWSEESTHLEEFGATVLKAAL